jgi:DeoR/GlpR family transcriptional regulator of sugar metabolism
VICPSEDIDVLITDDGISEEAAQAFARSGIQVISA